jgi:fluoroquinolone transport system permease protein
VNSLIKLTAGEVKRLIRYKILPVSLATSVLWVILFLFVSGAEARQLTPLVIFVDVAAMSILLLGASHHLEKQDGTIKTMMVLPVSPWAVLVAKTIASLVLALESALIVSVALFVIHRITFNYAALLAVVLIAGAAHAAIGFVMSLASKDFTTMLGFLMAYMFVFTIPSVLFSLGVIDAKYKWLLMLSPSHSANHLLTSAVKGEFNLTMTVFGSVYLVLLTVGLFRFVVYPQFKSNVVRG